MPQFFISYKRAAREDFVDELERRLVDADLRPFRDIRIKAGEEWKKEIELALKDCYAVILVLTEKAIENPKYIAHECSFAMGIGKKIIPIVLEKEKIDLKDAPIGVDERQVLFSEVLNFWEDLINRLNEIKSQYSDEIPLPVSLAATALNSPEPNDRRQSIKMLRTYDYPNDNPAVVRALEDALKHGYIDVRVSAALALLERTHYTDKRGVPALYEGLALSRHQLSEKILVALRVRHKPEEIAKLQEEGYVTDYSKIVEALQKVDDMETLERLWEIYRATHETPSISDRIEAIRLLAELGNRDILVRLREIGNKFNQNLPGYRDLYQATKSAIESLERKFLDEIMNDLR